MAKKREDILRCDKCGCFLPFEEHNPDAHVVTDDGDVLCLACKLACRNAERFPEIDHDEVDVLVVNHGSLYILHLHSEAAKAWVDENVSPEAIRWSGNLIVEPRYLGGLVDGMALDGLKLTGSYLPVSAA